MKKKFIVVDDDPINNLLCKYTISKTAGDSEIICFEKPAQALSFIAANYSSNENLQTIYLLLDINMPDINGWDFLEQFAEMNEHVHHQFVIYIVSSSVDPIDRTKACKNIFVKDFLSKPITSFVLENIILKNQFTF